LYSRLDLDRRMGAAGGGAADQQGDGRSRGAPSREATKTISSSDGVIRPDRPTMSTLCFFRGVEDAVGRDHDAQVDDLVVVTLQDHADDVLADVVDVALDGGHQDPAGLFARLAGLLGLHERLQPGHGLFHHPGRLHDLRQEHLARAEQVADHVHARPSAGLR
jgi:hypothetical protein